MNQQDQNIFDVIVVGAGPPGNGYERELVAGAALIGTVMGWQATCSIMALTLLLQLLQLLLAHSGWGVAQRWPLTGLMLLATTIHLCFWRRIVEHLSMFWPTTGFNLLPMVVWTTTCIGLIAMIRKITTSKAMSAPETI